MALESLFSLIKEIPPDSKSTLVWDRSGTTSPAQMLAKIEEALRTLQPLAGQRIGLILPESADGIAALVALEQLQCLTYLFGTIPSLEDGQSLAKQFNLSAVIQRSPSGWESTISSTRGEPGDPGVVIVTSGTEGPPKAVRHTWKSLLGTVRGSRPMNATALASQTPDAGPTAGDPARSRGNRSEERPRNSWLLGFRLQLYAGLQVLGQCLADQGTLVIPGQESSVNDLVAMMAQAGVTHASATPSYWRRLLIFGDRESLATVPLKQITLGGEMADQALLDSLRNIYPTARITHIYATTELGRCFAISDGLAGFPEEFLNRGSIPGVELEVHDGELQARSVNAAPPSQGAVNRDTSVIAELPWIATGDLVTILAGRVQFTGRKSEIINVGGNKVHPAVVEQVIRDVEGVEDVLVFPQASSIAGFLVACQVVPESGHAWDELRQRILQVCREKLRRHEVPRIVEPVTEITLSPAGKKRRRPLTPEQETL